MGWKKKKVSKEYAEEVVKVMLEGEDRRRKVREEDERSQAKASESAVAIGETAEAKEARGQRMREKREKEDAAATAKRVNEFYEQRRGNHGSEKLKKRVTTERLLTPPSEEERPGPHNGFKRTPLIDSVEADSEAGGWSHMTGSIDLIAARLGIEDKMTKGMQRRAEARHKALYQNTIDRQRHHTDLERLFKIAARHGKKKKKLVTDERGAGGYPSVHKGAIERERRKKEEDAEGYDEPWTRQKQKWPCQNCSMMNELDADRCELCNTSRPKMWSIRARKVAIKTGATKREKRSDGFGRRRYMDVPSDTFSQTEGIATLLENAAGRGFKVRKRDEQSTSTCKCETCGGTIHVKSTWYKEEKKRSRCPECLEGVSGPTEAEDYETSLVSWQQWTEANKTRYEKVVEANFMANKHPSEGGRKRCCWRCGSKKPGTESGAWLTHAADPNPNGNKEAVSRRYRFCQKCSNAIDRIGKLQSERSASNIYRQAIARDLLPQISPIKSNRRQQRGSLE
jgi:hypothetical protein